MSIASEVQCSRKPLAFRSEHLPTLVDPCGVNSDEYFHDVDTMKDDSIHYMQCEVTQLSGKGVVQLVYSKKNYGRGGFREGKVCVVFPFLSGKGKPGFRIQSAQAFNVTDPCMCPFEHTNCWGNKLATS